MYQRGKTLLTFFSCVYRSCKCRVRKIKLSTPCGRYRSKNFVDQLFVFTLVLSTSTHIHKLNEQIVKISQTNPRIYQANGLKFIAANRHPFGIVVNSCRSVNKRIGKISSEITSYLRLVMDVDRWRSSKFEIDRYFPMRESWSTKPTLKLQEFLRQFFGSCST